VERVEMNMAHKEELIQIKTANALKEMQQYNSLKQKHIQACFREWQRCFEDEYLKNSRDYIWSTIYSLNDGAEYQWSHAYGSVNVDKEFKLLLKSLIQQAHPNLKFKFKYRWGDGMRSHCVSLMTIVDLEAHNGFINKITRAISGIRAFLKRL
jgi:hypothetical protein